jgi:SNF2 family DNA or RNA helicase
VITSQVDLVKVAYDPVRLVGKFERSGELGSTIWERLSASALTVSDATVSDSSIELPWPAALNLLRNYGSRSQQQALRFRFAPDEQAASRIRAFAEEVRRARAARDGLVEEASEALITAKLQALSFTRELTTFQLRDLRRLLAMPHGANFSVPGAGKTTVTFALHLLTAGPGKTLLVVAPRAAFPAWKGIISECLSSDAPEWTREPFTILDRAQRDNDKLLHAGAARFLMSYDLLVRQSDQMSAFLSRRAVHVVLDESHRMKAGTASQRGAFLLSIAPLPARRDILTGTPMPQGPQDLAAQLGFLWPGQPFQSKIELGAAPREVLGSLYVRTTKSELGIPPAERHFLQVDMAPGHLALYGMVRDETLRQLGAALKPRTGRSIDVLQIRRSVMRLLQLSTNPILALQSISGLLTEGNSGVIERVLEEGPSRKMRTVENHARELAAQGRKVVVWTIFTDTLHEMSRLLADLNPVTLYGAVPNGDEGDSQTREGRLRRFHHDPSCMCLIANPAAAGEGISLHTVCHDAIYLDRSYVSTHYLQSVDRIHRLGLPPGTETNIYIYQTRAPQGIGSIDYSVNRRLARKIRSLQQLLDDPDLHQLALDEENADDPMTYDLDIQDVLDLIRELEGKPNSEAI